MPPGMSQFHSFGRKIPIFLVSRISPAVGRSPALMASTSGFPPSFTGLYTILKLYGRRSGMHRGCRSLSSFVVINVTRSLWSVRTLTGLDCLVYISSVLIKPEAWPIVACRICYMGIRPPTLSWMCTPLVSISCLCTGGIGFPSRRILRCLFLSWLVQVGRNRPVVRH